MSIPSVLVATAVSVTMSFGGMSTAPASQPEAVEAAEAKDAEDDVETEAEEEEAPEAEPTSQPDADLEDALVEEARERYVEGGLLFEGRRYIDAAGAYERSYAAVPIGKTLYNAALSYEKGGDIVRAVDAYQRYLNLPPCPAPQEHCAERREEVSGTVAKLRTKVGELSIEVDEGVDLRGIEIGDRTVPPEDFPLVLAPGHYEIRERGYGRDEVRIREIDIVAGQVFSLLVVDFDTPLPIFDEPKGTGGTPGAAPSRRLDEEERRGRLRIAFYSGVGVTAAAGIATGVVGALTLDAYQTYKGRCKGDDVDCTGTSFPADEKRRFDQLQPATNALIGVTAALGITTVVLGLFAFTGRKGAGARASVVRVSPVPGGVHIRF